MKGFYGERRFLSNFHPATIVYDGITYPTAEHAYQAAKTLDADQRRMVAQQKTPGDAKRAGRRLALRSDWEAVKLRVMLDILRLKFAPGSLFAGQLIETDLEELIEWNTWHDTFWGRCTCSGHLGDGRNALGRLLMGLREEFFA